MNIICGLIDREKFKQKMESISSTKIRPISIQLHWHRTRISWPINRLPFDDGHGKRKRRKKKQNQLELCNALDYQIEFDFYVDFNQFMVFSSTKIKFYCNETGQTGRWSGSIKAFLKFIHKRVRVRCIQFKVRMERSKTHKERERKKREWRKKHVVLWFLFRSLIATFLLQY